VSTLTGFVVGLGAFSVLQPLLEYRPQLASVFVAQLKVLKATDRRLTEHAAVSTSQRITYRNDIHVVTLHSLANSHIWCCYKNLYLSVMFRKKT